MKFHFHEIIIENLTVGLVLLQVARLIANYTIWYRLVKFGTVIRVALTGLIYRKVRSNIVNDRYQQ